MLRSFLPELKTYTVNLLDRVPISFSMRIWLTSIFLFACLTGFAQDEDKAYQEILDRHVKQGHINKGDIEKQQFYYQKDKEFRKEFNQKVRGVASTLKSPKDIIELDNPAIEISVD